MDNHNLFILEANFLNDNLYYGLGYSLKSEFSTNLFAGAVYDSYKMRLFVQVYDDDGAFAIYEISQSIIVRPNLTDLDTTIQKLILPDLNFDTNVVLNQGSYLPCVQIIQIISSLINEQSLSDKLGLILKDNSSFYLFPQTFGPTENFTGVNPNVNINVNKYNLNRNIRSSARDALIKYINSISIFDMDSVRTQLGMLVMVTSQTDEITRNSAVNKLLFNRENN